MIKRMIAIGLTCLSFLLASCTTTAPPPPRVVYPLPIDTSPTPFPVEEEYPIDDPYYDDHVEPWEE